MRIRDLELIVAVYEAGNLTLAAKQMGLSEPGLSKQLGVIERRIRVRLFDRGRGGAELTEAGRAFVEHARVSIGHSCARELCNSGRADDEKVVSFVRVRITPFTPKSRHDYGAIII